MHVSSEIFDGVFFFFFFLTANTEVLYYVSVSISGVEKKTIMHMCKRIRALLNLSLVSHMIAIMIKPHQVREL